MVTKTFLNYDIEFHEKMEDMKKNKSYFTDSFRDVFILGMCYAAKKSLKPLELGEVKKQDTIRIGEVIKEDHMFLFKVLAFSHTKDYKVVSNETQLYKLAEEFANAGIKEILDKYYKADYPSFGLAAVALEDSDE
jgi:hypothetical protein